LNLPINLFEEIMIFSMILLRIIGGLIALTSGAVALSAARGATLHRKSGMIFVYAMLFAPPIDLLSRIFAIQGLNSNDGLRRLASSSARWRGWQPWETRVYC
jgi:hypothetical protein